MAQLKALKEKDQIACLECSARRFAWFKPCSKETLKTHQKYRSAQHHLDVGDYLFMEGDKPRSVYTLQEGWIICFKSLANGQRQILHIGLAGDFIGHRINFDEAIDYSVVAVTKCTFCAFSEETVQKLLQADPKLINRLFEINDANNKECRMSLSYIGQSAAKLKVAFFLSKMIHRLKERGVDTSQSIYFPLTREEIADAIGITSVHLCRISVDMRRSGIVDCRHNRLDIMNIKKLEKLANTVF